MVSDESQFIYLTCKRESASLLKTEMAAHYPEYKFSYSRPGFQTYKLPESTDIPTLLQKKISVTAMKLAFASSLIMSLGKVRGSSPNDLPEQVRCFLQTAALEKLARLGSCLPPLTRVHVWNPVSPEATPETEKLSNQIRGYLSVPQTQSALTLPPRPGEACLDVILLSDTEWWLGVHIVTDYHSRFAGGYVPLVIPSDGTSRAWMKFEEGLRWSGFPIGRGSRCADIGASPGGGSQALLARGAEVLGIDPAEMAPAVLQNFDFTHLQGRIGLLKRKLFRKTRWLIADMNVAPNYTLDVLEELTQAPEIKIRGLLFTMKFFQLDMAGNIPEYLDRIRSWGFNQIKVRQLTFNRQEVMTAALKHPFRTR